MGISVIYRLRKKIFLEAPFMILNCFGYPVLTMFCKYFVTIFHTYQDCSICFCFYNSSNCKCTYERHQLF